MHDCTTALQLAWFVQLESGSGKEPGVLNLLGCRKYLFPGIGMCSGYPLLCNMPLICIIYTVCLGRSRITDVTLHVLQPVFYGWGRGTTSNGISVSTHTAVCSAATSYVP